ncbi:hypothetical protein EHT25_00040 [Larkinella rosea]|uniref:Uncharacterized protein n=1 Tax=Larkinella rosea TaxID=2025312 RepID=A0A3P1C7T9_9BACT|nr:hypothetical protein EHT25_00040 [Larkinella rosea]
MKLPTEAQWEYAARESLQSQGYLNSGGKTADAVGWVAENSGGQLRRSCRFSGQEVGLFLQIGELSRW